MRGARVCSLGELDVGRVVGVVGVVGVGRVVGVGTVVRGTEVVVVVVSGASSPPPPSPPPSSPPPLGGALGNVVGVEPATGVGPVAAGGWALRREYNNKFGEPAPAFSTTLDVAVKVIQAAICATLLSGAIPKPSAATPATCGEAIDVPEIVFVAVVEVNHADKMLEPGAKTSRQDP